MTTQKATNIKWHHGKISRDDRVKPHETKGGTIWLTGLSGSGKSTIAVELGARPHREQTPGLHTRWRQHTPRPEQKHFSPEDRSENIRRIGEVAKLFTDANIITITAFISPYRQDRDNARKLFQAGEFIEIYIKCPLEVCGTARHKGLYKKRVQVRSRNLPAYQRLMKNLLKPELTIDTSTMSIEESTRTIIAYLEEKGYVKF